MKTQTATTDPLVGRTLGEFTLQSRIGEGGFGAVYRALQVTLDRFAVVKVLRAGHRHRPDYAQRFLREAQLASRLDHPYAAHIYAFGAEPDGVLWIAMELVRGIPLNNLLRLQGAMPLQRFAPLLERICEVVHAAHEHGIVHRDLKPANVMVMSRAGRLLPKLLDFGIAKLLVPQAHTGTVELPDAAPADGEVVVEESPAAFDDELTPDVFVPPEPAPRRDEPITAPTDKGARSESGSPTPTPTPTPSSRDLTATGEAIGSPPYMAPEQWSEDGVVDARTDIYALGVLAYQCLTRRLPFVEDSTRAIADAHSRKPMPPLGGTFSREVEAVLKKALAKTKEGRFQSALDLGEAMRLAAGLRTERSQLPELDEAVRSQAMQEAPQPLAEAVGALAAAHNAHQARDSMWLVAHVAARLVGLVAIAARTRVGAGDGVDAEGVSDLLRQLRRRGLDDGEWVSLARELCRPFAKRADAYPVPELVRAFYDDEGELRAPLFEPLFDLRDQVTGGTEEQAQHSLLGGLPQVARLLEGLSFLSTYQLVVPRGGRAERWMGVRMMIRSAIPVAADDAQIVDGHPLLIDADGNIVLALYPLLQVSQPAPGAPEELFLLEGQGRNGARLVALPAGFERQEAAFWELSRSVLVHVEDHGPSALDERAPYRGLSTFRPEDAAVFFGREREAEALVNRLRIQGMVAVVGPSGAGKSSFVQAGVIPNLPRGWKTLTVRPGAQPLTALRARLAKDGFLVGHDHADVAAEANAIRAVAARQLPEAALLIIIDQFEELFTLCADADERKQYAELIADLGRSPKDPVRVIVTLRDDFLIRADEMVALRERLALGLQLVTTPAAEDLLRILIEPARRSGYAFDDAKLPWEMVQAVVGQPGALPLLSFTASKLWEQRDRSGRLLPKKAYEAMGGVGGALAQHAEQTLETMSEPERQLVREAFRRLVTSEGTRAVLSRGELLEVLGDRAHGEAVLEKLINARLLSASEGMAATAATSEAEATPGSTDQIEVVHEALLGAWPRLVRWRSEDAEGARLRDQLRQAAQQWAARGRPRGLLWRDEALTEYRIWRQRFPGRSTALEEEFGQASTAYAAAGRRIRRGLLLLAFSALSVFIVFLTLANRRVTASSKLAKEALAQSNEEQGRQYLLSDKPLEALVYLQEAFSAGHQSAGMRFMLGRILYLLSAEKWAVRPDPNGLALDVSADGTRVATATGDDHVQIIDTNDGRVVGRVQLAGERLTGALFSPDGKTVAIVGKGLAVWDLAGASGPRPRPRSIAGTDGLGALSASWSADGERLSVQGENGGRAFDPRTGALIEKWGGAQRPTPSIYQGARALVRQEQKQLLARTPTGEGLSAGPVGTVGVTAVQLATHRIALNDESGISVWSPSGSRVVSPKAEDIRQLLFGPGQSPLLVAITVDGMARVFDVDAQKQVALLATNGASAVQLAPDGKQLALGFADGRVRLFDVASWQPIEWLYGRRDKIYALVFVANGLFAASADGSLALFDLAPREPTFVAKLPDGVQPFSAALDAAGDVWAATSDAKVLRFARSSGDIERLDITNPHGPLQNATFEDHARIVLSTSSGWVQLWDLAAKKMERDWQAHAQPLTFGQLSPDGARVVTTAGDNEVRLWDRRTQALVHAWKFKPTSEQITAVFDATGTRVLSAGFDSADLWNVTSFASEAHYYSARALNLGVISPNGAHVLLAGAENAAHVFSSVGPAAAMEATLPGHSLDIGFAAFLDDHIAVTATLDGTIRVWDWPTSKLASKLTLHTGAVNWGSTRGLDLATAGADGRVATWHLPSFTGDEAALRRAAEKNVFTLNQGVLTVRSYDQEK